MLPLALAWPLLAALASPAPDPVLAEAYRFAPCRSWTERGWVDSERYWRHVKEARDACPYGSAVLEDQERYAYWVYRCWYEADDALYYYPTSPERVRQALRNLRALLGPDYHAGRLPPYAPNPARVLPEPLPPPASTPDSP